MDLVAEFVRQYGFDLVGGVIVEQRIRQDDSASRAQPGQSRIGLLAFFGKPPPIDAADARSRPLAEHNQAPPQLFVVQWFELVKDGKQYDRGQLGGRDE